MREVIGVEAAVLTDGDGIALSVRGPKVEPAAEET